MGWTPQLVNVLFGLCLMSVCSQQIKSTLGSTTASLTEKTTTTASLHVSNNSVEASCKKNHVMVNDKCLQCGCAKKRICDAETGECPTDRCKKGRHELSAACVYGIVSIRNEKANPGAPTNATCLVRTVDAENDAAKVSMKLSSREEKYFPLDTKVLDVNTIETTFYLTSGLRIGDSLTCALEMTDGQVISRTTSAQLFDLPILSRSPETHLSSFGRYFSLRIHRWDPSKGDSGDGPILRYSVKMCQLTESQQCLVEDLKSFSHVSEVPPFTTDSTPVYTLKPFKPGANYSLIYLANRDGMYGPPSPPLHVQMPCKYPQAGPTIHKHNYTMVELPKWKTVNVTFTWQLPNEEQIQCNYISEVHLRLTSESNEVQRSVVAGTVTSYSIQLTPYTSYTILVSYRNNAGLTSTSDMLRIDKTLPASPGAPVITHVHMHNKTCARVYWTSPVSPNGKIDGYQVLYSKGSSLNYTIGCGVEHPSSSPTCLVDGLRLNNFYNFTARAKNSVGFGDNSTMWKYKATLTVPGPVDTLRNTSKTAKSILLQWQKPNNTGGLNITSYKLTCIHGDLTMGFLLITEEFLKDVVEYNVTNLPESTNFTCQVNAQNDIGISPPSQQLVVFTNPPEPTAPPLPILLEEMSTDRTSTIEVRAALGSSRLHRVVVMETEAKVKRDVNVISIIKPESCGKCCSGSCYIAGELLSDQLPMKFVIGDNKSYRGYVNKPLDAGKTYDIWYGAGDEVDGVPKFKYVLLSQPVVAMEYIDTRGSSLSSPALIGIIVAVSVSAIIAILLLMVFIRYRRNKRFKFRTENEKITELTENGKLLTNGTYQKGDALSVDSLDYSRQPNGEPVYDNVRLKHYAIMVEELRQYIELKSADDGFKKEYNHIPWGLKFSHDVAKHPDNKLKNRYGNIIAYDHSRVILKGKNPDQDTDYINASYIDGYTTPKEYIATQGPNKFTVNDLWHMAWQEETAIIVMVTNTIELTKHKCEQYWPEEGSKQCGDIRVTLSNTKSLAHYKIRTFTMEQNAELRNIKQFHFTAWPDHGTPTHATTLLSFLKKVRQNKTPDDGPIICHCSAGVGRSGTFIALDSLLQQAESEGKIDVYSYVTQMRKQRCNMIQTLDQYIFLHEAILEACEGFDSSIRISAFKSEYKYLKEKQSKHRSLIDMQYQKLKEILYVGRTTVAAENQLKNRRSSVIPFNNRRVLLVNSPSNYINATYIDDHRKRSTLIATQHPLSSTVEDLWRMILNQQPFALLTLCASSATVECSEKQDLPVFWPTVECRTKEYTSVSVELLDEADVEQIPHITKQSITVHSKCETVFQPQPAELDHYLCHFWPSEKSLPSQTESFVKLVAMLEHRKQENGDRMLVINCVDGAKQCGLYIACHSLIQQMIMDSEVDVPETIRLIRNDQSMFISSSDQFEFCYKFVSEYMDSCNQDSAVFTCL